MWEGDFYFLLISFSKGVYPLCIPHGGEHSPAPPPTRRGFGLGCRLGRSWTVPTGHQDPPRTPRFRRKARAFLQTGRFRWLRCYPPPAPSRARTLQKEGAALAREGDFIFHILSFSRGQVSAAASVGPGRCPPGTRTPLAPPRACLALVHRFILCFLEAELASPYGGAGAQWAPFCADRTGRRDSASLVEGGAAGGGGGSKEG